MMKKKYAILFLSIGFIGVMICTYIEYKWGENLHTEFPDIALNTEMHSKVKELYRYGGAIFVTLRTQKMFLPAAGNKSYSFEYPQEIIKIGDSIVKNKNSDTLYLYHDNNKYWFKLFLEK